MIERNLNGLMIKIRRVSCATLDVAQDGKRVYILGCATSSVAQCDMEKCIR